MASEEQTIGEGDVAEVTAGVPATRSRAQVAQTPEEAAAISREIAERLSQAETVDDLLQATTPKEDLKDAPIQVLGFEEWPGDYGDESTFAAMEVVDLDGKLQVVTCGGEKLIAQLRRAGEKGWFPLTCRLTSAETSRGFETWFLAKVRRSS